MINIAEILKNVPNGTKLYSPLFGEVEFMCVDLNLEPYPIRVICDSTGTKASFDRFGCYNTQYSNAECLLFPSKECRDWATWRLPIEPKFKVGDWLQSNCDRIHPALVTDYSKWCGYQLQDGSDRCHLSRKIVEDEYHLWTINDAKPGDILNANGAVFIYKKHNKDFVYHYCGINLGYEFVIGSDDSIWNINNKIYPATQEQKDLLFNKIKEAGYTWNLYSNTLTKKTKFKIGDWVTDGICKAKIIDIDNKYYWYSKNSMLGEIESIDKKYHIWSVEDVKPGDVIDYKGEISIYKHKHSIKNNNKKNNVFGGFGYYCCYDGKRLWIDGFYSLTEKDKFDIHPATEEQIETLFSYMTPAGYIWDFNNKTLKKTKFKIGNWIVSNVDKSIGQITKIIWDKQDPNTLYAYEHTNGFFTNDFEDNYHLWTIQDANDGDILFNSTTFIYNGNYDDTFVGAYCGIDASDYFIPGVSRCRWSHVQGVKPATKEQRDLLFKKMKETGYEWDADKKELRKIKSHYDIKNFKPFDKVLTRDTGSGKWMANLFSNYISKDEWAGTLTRFRCVNSLWIQCIPFEGNEHLLGTTKPCDEKFINW